MWTARSVVIATGYHSRAKVPEFATGLAMVLTVAVLRWYFKRVGWL